MSLVERTLPPLPQLAPPAAPAAQQRTCSSSLVEMVR
jgi:hypothetical protein